MTKIIAAVFALALSVMAIAVPGTASAQVDCRIHTTNPACIKHSQAPGIPTNCPDPQWYKIHQSGPGKLTLNIYDLQNGRWVQVNATNPQHNEQKQGYDTFCIGGHWLNKGHMFEWCTDGAGRVMSRDRMIAYANTDHVIELVPSPNNLPYRPGDLPKVQRAP